VSEPAAGAPRFRRLPDEGSDGEAITADQALRDWRVEGEQRLHVALNMIVSVDGRIAVNGRSGALGGPADRSLFHALRARADAVMAGAGTMRIERYGPIIRDEAVRERRVAEGLSPQPVAVAVTRRLGLDASLPLLADPDSHVIVITPAAGELPPCPATVDYIRSATLSDGLAQLHARHNVRLLLCEGGPSLSATLAAEDLIDELFVSISPMLVGDTPDGRAMLTGAAPATPLPLRLAMLLEHDSHLFARYSRRPPEPSAG
jgi:riboflavin biosynthesis pyrimidine reductase